MPLPRILPMKAVTGELPAVDEWAYEIKWDGMRVVAYVNDDVGPPLRLETTRGHDAAPRFPELAGLPGALAPHATILDGEVVAFEGDRPSFGRLQHRMHVTDPAAAARLVEDNPVYYVVFDLLHLDGNDLTDLPYRDRHRLLTQLVETGPSWRVPEQHTDGAALLEIARAKGLEGVMAKRVESRYLPGKRSPSWVKIKVRYRQEFVVGGWHPGTGNRTGQIGSLLVGYYEGDELRYAGKLGTGFSMDELVRLGRLLDELATPDCPFTPGPPAGVVTSAHWVRPELVAEATFGEWTSEGILRAASYLGLRDDKDPTEVVRER